MKKTKSKKKPVKDLSTPPMKKKRECCGALSGSGHEGIEVKSEEPMDWVIDDMVAPIRKIEKVVKAGPVKYLDYLAEVDKVKAASIPEYNDNTVKVTFNEKGDMRITDAFRDHLIVSIPRAAVVDFLNWCHSLYSNPKSENGRLEWVVDEIESKPKNERFLTTMLIVLGIPAIVALLFLYGYDLSTIIQR